MEHTEIHHLGNVLPCEEEKELASSSYLMSLIAIIVGLPMPIINLIATGIFFVLARKKSFFVRWHCTQALLSQIPLFVINNILFWWTIHLLFGAIELSSLYFSYLFLVLLYNTIDFIATVRCAVSSRQGSYFRWYVFGTITDIICKK